MAKLIRPTEETLKMLRENFEKELRNLKAADGRISFSTSVGSVDRKAHLIYSEVAWEKQCRLVNEFSSEVGWHGVARRYGDSEDDDQYFIEDIIVYPQEVSGTTVNTDQEEYEDWMMKLHDDQFNNLRMQGHSHVNMSTSPSGVDLTHQEGLLAQLEDDMFYIFVIWNKRNDRTVKIYDMKKNVLFEDKDISVSVLDQGLGLYDFMKTSKELVKTKTYAPAKSTQSYKENDKKKEKDFDDDYWGWRSRYYGG